MFSIGRLSILTLFALSIVVVPFASSTAAASDPYRQGTERVNLSEQEIKNLMLFAVNSKSLLEKAKRDAKGKSLYEVNEVYEDAIKNVVVESNKKRGRSELLLRFVLNQALELTTGTPTADGKSVLKPGVLAASSNIALITTIFEDSIDLALKLYEADAEALEAGNIVQLPYLQTAFGRIKYANNWLTGVHRPKLMKSFQVAVLEQWQLTILQQDNLNTYEVAEELLETDKTLKLVASGKHHLMQENRVLRALIERHSEKGIVGEFLTDSSEAPSYVDLLSDMRPQNIRYIFDTPKNSRLYFLKDIVLRRVPDSDPLQYAKLIGETCMVSIYDREKRFKQPPRINKGDSLTIVGTKTRLAVSWVYAEHTTPPRDEFRVSCTGSSFRVTKFAEKISAYIRFEVPREK